MDHGEDKQLLFSGWAILAKMEQRKTWTDRCSGETCDGWSVQVNRVQGTYWIWRQFKWKVLRGLQEQWWCDSYGTEREDGVQKYRRKLKEKVTVSSVNKLPRHRFLLGFILATCKNLLSAGVVGSCHVAKSLPSRWRRCRTPCLALPASQSLGFPTGTMWITFPALRACVGAAP